LEYDFKNSPGWTILLTMKDRSMSHSVESIELAIREFVANGLKNMDIAELDKNTSLIASGVIDSFEIVNIISHLEGEYEVELDANDLNVENFSTTATMAELIYTKLSDIG